MPIPLQVFLLSFFASVVFLTVRTYPAVKRHAQSVPSSLLAAAMGSALLSVPLALLAAQLANVWLRW